jgi:hypothetical protein
MSILTAAICLIAYRGFSQSNAGQIITSQPSDQLAPKGADVTFSISAVHGSSYQWMLNGMPIIDQTNSAFVIENVQPDDVGYFSCVVSVRSNSVTSDSASLMVDELTPGLGIVVYALPIVSGGSEPSCPGSFEGYVNYTKTPANGWGWTPTSGATTIVAEDENRSNTKIEYVGAYGDSGCAKTSVSIPHPAESPAYRFSIYFTSNVPTTNYPITLIGFNP